MEGISEPLYALILRELRNRILNRDLPPGTKLPTEESLAEMYDVTRGTARRALAALHAEGLVTRKKGQGTYVNHVPPPQNFWNFGSLTDRLQAEGRTPTAKVLAHDIVTKDGRPMLYLERLRGWAHEGESLPLSLDASLIPLEIFPEIDTIDFTNRSLYAVFRNQYGRIPTTTVLEFQSRSIDDHTRTLLAESPFETSLIRVSSRTFDQHGAQIEEADILYSSRVQMVMSFEHGHTSPFPRQNKGVLP